MKKLLKIVFVTLVCLFLIVVIGGYVVLKHVDLNQYKGLVENQVQALTGRELKIGDIHIKPAIKPTIQLQDVEFANASWSKTPNMVEIGTINVRIALIPLLNGKYVINRFLVSDAVVNLEENADGQANWVFDVPEKKEEAAQEQKSSYNLSLISNAYAEELNGTPVEATSGSAGILSNIDIEEVDLENVKINYTDRKAQSQSYEIEVLDLNKQDNERIGITFDVNDGLYQGAGEIGALSLLESPKGYPVKADLEIMGISLTTDVTLFDLFGNLGFEGNVKAKNFMGKGSSYDESADVNVKGDLKNIDAVINSFKMAGNVIKGKVNVKLDESLPEIKANLKSDKIDIASFGENKKSAWNISLIKEAQATTMIPSEKIPYEYLNIVRANADMAVAKVFNKKEILAENLVLKAKVSDGKASINIVDGKIANGSVKGSASLDGKSKAVSMNADMVKVNLINLFKALDVQSDSFNFISGGDADMYLNLTGHGNTYAAVGESLDGRLVFIVDKSKLHLGNIGMIKGNIVSQLFNTLKLTKGNDDLKLKCAVVRADVKDGLATFPNGVVVNADKFTVVADGTINLKNDKLGFGIKPFGGKLTDTNIAKALSSLVRLSGTLQNPSVGVDTANVVKNVVGATMTGPVYLGAQMVMENDSSPCYTALKDTGYEDRFPKSSNVTKSTTDHVGKALDNSVGMVKDTAKGFLNMISGRSEKKQ